MVTVGKEGGITPRITEHSQEFLSLLPVGGGEHEQHDAQVIGGVRASEEVVFFEELDAPAACAFQRLAVGMFTVPEGSLGLGVDGPGRGDPEGQSGLAWEAFQCFGRQQGLAAASGDFEADMGDWTPCVVGAAGVLTGGFGNAAGLIQALPSGLGVVTDVVGHVGANGAQGIRSSL